MAHIYTNRNLDAHHKLTDMATLVSFMLPRQLEKNFCVSLILSEWSQMIGFKVYIVGSETVTYSDT